MLSFLLSVIRFSCSLDVVVHLFGSVFTFVRACRVASADGLCFGGPVLACGCCCCMDSSLRSAAGCAFLLLAVGAVGFWLGGWVLVFDCVPVLLLNRFLGVFLLSLYRW